METLLDLLPRIDRLGSREALRFSNEYRTRRWTYRDLSTAIRRFVAYLDARGLGAGDRLAIWSENRPEWVAVFWACLARRIEVVPLDRNSSPELAGRIATQTGARLLVHSGSPEGLVPSLERFAIESLHGLPDGPAFTADRAGSEDVVEVVYTSGTTAEPKGVVHRHRNICANLNPIREEIDRYGALAGPFQPIRILNLLPLSHMFGQSMGIFIPPVLGGSAAFLSGLHPAAIRRTIRRSRISVLVCVPRILDSLRADLERSGFRPVDLVAKPGGPLRRWWRHRDIHRAFGLKFWAFVVGGATLDPETEAFWARVGLPVIQGYGLTETSAVVSVNHPFRARRGTLGEVVGEQEVRIAEDGEILVRGDSVVGEYLEAGNRRVRAVDERGWFHTGDLGMWDAGGRLVFKGRKKDVIVTADGMNVYPGDIEREAVREPGVREAAVVQVGRSGAAQIHAALILDGTREDPLAIAERVNRRLEAHQRIQSASRWPEDEFPRTTSTFKIQRRKVAERLDRETQGPPRDEPEGLDGLLASLTQRRPEEIPDEGRLAEDLGLSSLEQVDLLASLENEYGVELSERAFSTLSTVGQVRAWVEGQAEGDPALDGEPALQATVGGQVAVTAHAPFPRWARRRPASALRAGFRRGLFIPLFLDHIPLTVGGLRNLEALTPPVIFAANHASHLDTVALTAVLPTRWQSRLAPAVREDFFFPTGDSSARGQARRIGLRALYWLCCGLFNAYPLPQGMGQVRDSLRYTGELVDAGYCPLVYPEGRLTPDGSLQPFRPGVGLMSLRLEVPVVPVHMSGLFEIMSEHDRWPRKGAVHVEFGAPVAARGDEDYVRLAERIETSVHRLPAVASA